MQKRISIDLVFSEEFDRDFPEDGPWYYLSEVNLAYSEISPEGRGRIAESLGQSDIGYIGMPNAIITAIGDGTAVEFE